MLSGSLSRVSRLLFALTVVGLFVVPGSSPASAHTDLDFTVPAADEVVTTPITEIVVAFTDPVTLVGDAFEVLDPQGTILQPEPETDDGSTYTLRFDPPLAGGAVGVRYTVRAEDGHEISGAYSFTVDAPVPTTAPATVATTAPASTAPASTDAPDDTATPATEAPSTTAALSSTTVVAPTTEPVTGGSSNDAIDEPAPDTDADGDGGSNTGLFVALGAAAVLAVGGIALVRSRTAT